MAEIESGQGSYSGVHQDLELSTLGGIGEARAGSSDHPVPDLARFQLHEVKTPLQHHLIQLQSGG